MARKKLTEETKKKKLTISINENMLVKLKILSDQQNISLSQLIENILEEK
jgi:predicted HicB family RNase H-like nuclease